MRESLTPTDERKELDDELYAEMADQWVARANIDERTSWSSYILASADQPQLSEQMARQLDALRDWLLRRIWPRRYARLENSFENFRRVLGDFCETFYRRALLEDDSRITEKFYQIKEWDPELYGRLLNQYEMHVDLVCSLMVGLTRAANYVCDEVRLFLSRKFRLEEGKLVLLSGLHMSVNDKA